MTAVFIEPCDVVFFRDDMPFGTPGNQAGRCRFPPRPSVVAGALRSRVLVDQGVNPQAFADGSAVPEVVAREIGRVRREANRAEIETGTFRLTGLALGQRDAKGQANSYYRAGFDLVAGEAKRDGAARKETAAPAPLELLAPSSERRVPGASSLGSLDPVAVTPGLSPTGGWLEAEAYGTYLAGTPPSRGAVLSESAVVDWDDRVGIGLDPEARTVDEGKLFSSRGAAMKPGWGFVVTVEGCSLIPTSGLILLGGDGRMARLGEWQARGVDWTAIKRTVVGSGRFRLVLQTPAVFQHGWRPAALREEGGQFTYDGPGFRARLRGAMIGSPELAGGWDLVRGAPKPFRLMVPAGSVYWFEVVSGSAEDAWQHLHGRSISDEKGEEGFGIVHMGGW